MKRITKAQILIGFILLISLLIRIWGLSYDLPYIYHPDEPWPIRIGYQMLVTHDFNPHFFDWPAFIIYVNMVIQAFYYPIIRVLGLGNPSGITNPLIELTMGVTFSPVPIIVLLGRLTTVCFGIGTIAATIFAGKEIARDIKVGLLAGMLMAIFPTNVSLNRYITPDTYATFFLSVVFLASIYIFRSGKTWAYVIAGISLGLAASSKYNSALIVIVLLASHFFRTGWHGFKDYRLYLALFLGGLTFLIVNPYALLAFPEFFAGFLSVSKHYSTGHPGMEGNTLSFYLNYMWQTGGMIYILATLEILRGIYSRSKEIILLSIFPVVYFIFITSYIVRNDRTFLPLTIFAFLLAASLLMHISRNANALRSNVFHRWFNLAMVCLLLVCLIWPSSQTIKDTIQLTAVNSRATARIWIADNLPRGSHIAIESYSPFIDPTQYSVQGLGEIINYAPNWYIQNGFDYLVFSQGMYGRFFLEPKKYPNEVTEYDRFFGQFFLVKKFNDGNYEIRIYKVN
jgi:4-amino-4-deoxy-L-arabinose transferase-like glycosyltransferase